MKVRISPGWESGSVTWRKNLPGVGALAGRRFLDPAVVLGEHVVHDDEGGGEKTEYLGDDDAAEPVEVGHIGVDPAQGLVQETIGEGTVAPKQQDRRHGDDDGR